MHLRHGASLPRFPAFLPPLAAFAIGALATWNARASDEKQVCLRAVEHAQLVRLDGKLREAREGFMTCARAVCPDAIRQDCTRWVTEVDASLPTVVFEAVWADGRDVAGLTVMLDGQPLADAGAGRAVALDPGKHTFRFEAPGAAAIETQNVIREGEKNRILHVALAPGAPVPLVVVPVPALTPSAPVLTPPAPVAALPAPAPTPPPTTRSPAPIPAAMWHLKPGEEGAARSTRRPIPTSAFVVGGFALAGFGGFAIAGIAGTNQLNYLRATCAPTCDPSVVTAARQEILIGDILGYVALAAAGVTTLLVLTRPTVPADDETR
jgi:hypothetical protein